MKRFLFFFAVLFMANFASAQGQILVTNNTSCWYEVKFTLFNSNCSQVLNQTYIIPPMGSGSIMTMPPPPGFTFDVASVRGTLSGSSDICDLVATVQSPTASCTSFPNIASNSSCCNPVFTVHFVNPTNLMIN